MRRPPFQVLADLRMGLETLEFVEGGEIRVLVVEPDHEADRDLVVGRVVHPRPAVGPAVHRPADRVDDQARPVAGRIDLPQFLDADAVGLGIAIAAQVEALEQALGQRPAATLGQKGLARVQFHAGRVVIGPLAVLADSHIAGGDALDRPVLVEQHLGCREARIDLNPQRLGLGRHPPRHLADADDVVALVVHRRRRRKFVGLRLRQKQEEILGRRDP